MYGGELTADDHRWARGSSLVGLLAALVVMGALTLVMLRFLTGNSTSPSVPTVGSNASTAKSAAPAGLGSDLSVAAKEVCEADYQAAVQAVSEYQELHDSWPSSISQVESMLRDQLSSSHFTIAMYPGRPGQLEVAAPGHSPTPGDSNCAYAR
jgi:hypothetical protein